MRRAAGGISRDTPSLAGSKETSRSRTARADFGGRRTSLRWASDAEPGLRRVRRGRGFSYFDADGQAVHDPRELQRIRALAIPPAYRRVWVCSDGRGHLQATGRDARGRKQYRYHPQWRSLREATKFEHLHEFGLALPRIRRAVCRQLEGRAAAPTRERVLAALVRLLDTTWLRIGNEEYLRANGSFGLSTLRKRHAQPWGSEVRLSFGGKSGVRQEARLDDPRVARVVRRCQALPGQALFRYVDADGEVHSIDSTDVNAWLEAAAGTHVTAKDFRTWHGTVQALDLALEACARTARGDDPSATCVSGPAVVAAVARRLGNTAAVCRKSYIHPLVMEQLDALADETARRQMPDFPWALAPPAMRGLRIAERRLLALIAPGVAPSRRSSKRRVPR